MQASLDSLHDPHGVEIRRRTIRTGVWPTLFVCLFAGMYAASSWDQPNRPLLVGIIVVTVVSSIAVRLVPLDWVLRGRWREPFFLGYSASVTGFLTAAIVADGGGVSPLMPMMFLPLVFAAVSYPLVSMLLVGLMNLTAFNLVALLTEAPLSMELFMFAVSLATAAWICAWLSHNHEVHRRTLARASRTDPLTGCLNRRGFTEAFDLETARAGRQGLELTYVLVDLDRFKAVNDKHGHAAGDALLVWVADRLRTGLRANDVVARLGGDEFALLTDADPMTAQERVRALLSPRAPASVGTAVFPGDGKTLDELSRVSDRELYDRKGARPRKLEQPLPA